MAYPEHILPTDDLSRRMRFDVAQPYAAYLGYTLHKIWHWLKSSDYTELWVELEIESQDGTWVWAFMEATDGITTAVSAEFSTNLQTWQDSGKSIISLAGFNNVICDLKLYVGGKGRVRGVVALEA